MSCTHTHNHRTEYWASPISLKAANETTVLCYCSIFHRLDINRKSGVGCIRQTVPMMRDHTHKNFFTFRMNCAQGWITRSSEHRWIWVNVLSLQTFSVILTFCVHHNQTFALLTKCCKIIKKSKSNIFHWIHLPPFYLIHRILPENIQCFILTPEKTDMCVMCYSCQWWLKTWIISLSEISNLPFLLPVICKIYNCREKARTINQLTQYGLNVLSVAV